MGSRVHLCGAHIEVPFSHDVSLHVSAAQTHPKQPGQAGDLRAALLAEADVFTGGRLRFGVGVRDDARLASLRPTVLINQLDVEARIDFDMRVTSLNTGEIVLNAGAAAGPSHFSLAFNLRAVL